MADKFYVSMTDLFLTSIRWTTFKTQFVCFPRDSNPGRSAQFELKSDAWSATDAVKINILMAFGSYIKYKGKYFCVKNLFVINQHVTRLNLRRRNRPHWKYYLYRLECVMLLNSEIILKIGTVVCEFIKSISFLLIILL